MLLKYRILSAVLLFVGTFSVYYWMNYRNVYIRDEYHKRYLEEYKENFEKMESDLVEKVQEVLTERMTRMTRIPVFTKHECDMMIYEAEKHAGVNGWTQKRHENYPTTDIPVSELNAAFPMVMSKVYELIIPKVAALFEFDKRAVDVCDLFLIRYSARKQNRLVKHHDGSLFSFVVPLNDDFDGGGTHLNGETHKPGVGEALLFCGQQKHSGVAVTRGTRYVLAGFLYSMDP